MNDDFPTPSRLQPFTVFTMMLAALSLYALWEMTHWSGFMPAALAIGGFAFLFDFLLEYLGVKTLKWRYQMGKSVVGVPLLIPLFFLFGGILATFAFYILNAPEVTKALADCFLLDGISLLQFIFLALAAFFLTGYFLRPANNCLTFGLLPLAFALYVEFNQPWMLLLSLLPVYVDYYLEGRMVKKKEITYKDGNAPLAHLVALTYFSTTLLLMGLVGYIMRYVFDFPVRSW